MCFLSFVCVVLFRYWTNHLVTTNSTVMMAVHWFIKQFMTFIFWFCVGIVLGFYSKAYQDQIDAVIKTVELQICTFVVVVLESLQMLLDLFALFYTFICNFTHVCSA